MRNEKQYHFIYKTTNLLSGKYYIGMHSTDNLDDGYMGSGRRLRYSLNKYGKQNHKREILEFCKTRNELISRETEIVNLNELAKIDCINLQVGGGINGFMDEDHRLKAQRAGGKVMFNIINNRRKLDVTFDQFISSKVQSGLLEYYKTHDGSFTGKSHTEETKQKMRKSKNVGCNNSQYGTCWITNEIENKKIYKGDTIPNDWKLGRTFKLKN